MFSREGAGLSFVQDVDPEELACQLTLTEQRLYNAIRPYEVLAHVHYSIWPQSWNARNPLARQAGDLFEFLDPRDA